MLDFDKVIFKNSCPICKKDSEIKFSDSPICEHDPEQIDIAVMDLESKLDLDEWDLLEKGQQVFIESSFACNTTLCERHKTRNASGMALNIDVPKRFKDVAPSKDVDCLKEGCGYINGEVGVGKTTLAVALLKGWLLANSKDDKLPSYKFITSAELLFSITEEFNVKKSTKKRILRECMSTDILVLDDLGAEKFSEWSTSQLYLLLNSRYEHVLPTIVTSNLSLKRIAITVSDRIASRISTFSNLLIEGGDKRLG